MTARISIDEVAAAYEKTGLGKMAGDYICDGSACPIGAMASLTGEKSTDWADHHYGSQYRSGFTNAIDGLGCVRPNSRYIQGYEDGLAVKKVFFQLDTNQGRSGK